MRGYVDWAVVAILLVAASGGAVAQDRSWQGADRRAEVAPGVAQAPPDQPDQPVMPQAPSLHRRGVEEGDLPARRPVAPAATAQQAGPPQPPAAPFVLTPVEEEALDRVLLFWEQSSQNVKTFRCKFTRFIYDAIFRKPGEPDKPRFIDEGELRFSAPDKGLYAVGRPREERWVCDGKSIFQYDYQKKQVIEHKLPAEVQGKAISNGPLPFLFGAKAEQLKRRYWLRIITPPDTQNAVWLEAYPRTIQDAQNFKKAEVILSVKDNQVQPSAVQIYETNGQDRTVYAIRDVVINRPDPRQIFEDPFHGRVPAGWKKVVEEAPEVPNAAQRPGLNR